MMSDRARELLGSFVGRRVLLVGDLMMDEWAFGTVARISPEAPIPVVRMPLTPQARTGKPGGAGNVAAILLGLGAAVKVVGAVGDDENGRRLRTILESSGADVSPVLTDTSRPTTHKLRIIAGRQQLLRIDTEATDPIAPELAGQIRDQIRSGMAEADVVLVADYAKGLLTEGSFPGDVIAEARAARIPLCVDPKPANIGLFRGAYMVSPNEAEALAAAGNTDRLAEKVWFEEGDLDMPRKVLLAGIALQKKLKADMVFVTRGDQGIAVFDRDGVHEIPTASVEGGVGDGTGCGDAAIAASALSLASGADLWLAAIMANAAGGVVSRFVGVHSPQPDEIVEWVEQNWPGVGRRET
jgi:D-beta-D-heptose 7-phosphate kinase/D-beta-D-heptose 1-phosphate adenosyltransferase